MATYNYTRTLTNGEWDINNPKDVDANGISVTLAQRIKEDATLGPLLVGVSLNNASADVVTTTTLNGSEINTLDNIVATHKAANGTKDSASEIDIYSPNGTFYQICVDNAGNLTTKTG